jgi:Mlc titration factor MtfA (ptsG expression regulator)
MIAQEVMSMVFPWVKRWRRRRCLAQAFPREWNRILRDNVYDYARLTEGEQAKLRDDLRILVAEKNWEGCGGLRMTDEVKVTIAAQASLLLLGFHDEYFDQVLSILVYPDAYVAPERTMAGDGMVLEGESDREGEAWYRGPIILSWADALSGGRRESGGGNLVLHEFAHQLDMQNGRTADGTPPLRTREELDRWREVTKAEYDRLVDDCHRGRATLLDCYGATDMSEFFAVATECFFQQPRQLSQRHPRLYTVLREFYRQDPAVRE